MRNKQISTIDGPVRIAKALADKSRMRVIAALIYKDELCVCQITELVGLAISTVSRHISLLQDAGLLRSRKQDKWVYYRLSDKIPSELKKWIEDHVVNTKEASIDRQKVDKALSCDLRKPGKKG